MKPNNRILAALQIGSHSNGTADTLEQILTFEDSIKQTNCDHLVLPEALLGGYPKGADFGAKVGFRTPQGREDFLQYWEQSVELDGPEVQTICKLAQRCQTSMVIGVIERANTTLYCTALFISDEGKLVSKHRKLVPTASERLIWGRGDGSTIPIVETNAGKVGAAICWENYMPLLRNTMYAKGVEIWCAPTVDDRDIWQASMRHIAYEARCFLVSACQFQSQILEDTGKPAIRGGSVIVSPMGEVLAGPLYGEAGLISAEIDLNDIVRARYDLDATGHYGRPDIFNLTVDERPKLAIDVVKGE